MSLYNKIVDLQKLNQAWQKVRSNKPSAGVDGISWDMYDADSVEENKLLSKELRDKTYACKPVRLVTIYKEDKAREIALYSMRDKVVQQSLALELKKLFEADIARSAYAYRDNKSALSAVGEVEKQISTGRYEWVLKVDIQHYFDSIRWEYLEPVLKKRIREEDVLELLREECCVSSIDREGNLCPKEVGVYQGASVAPILSNLYLTNFDHEMEKRDCFYLRYSDDMLILSDTREKLSEILISINSMLSGLGLRLSEKKTVLTELTKGVNFLGYYFDIKGKTIAAKAVDQLAGRLEAVWLMNREDSCENRLRKLAEILNGWEQYFRGEREIGGILEYAALVYMTRNKKEIAEIAEKRRAYVNIYEDIMLYLSKVWKEKEFRELQLFEYEQFFGFIADTASVIQVDDGAICDLIALYEVLISDGTRDALLELMQKYSDLHMYEQASLISDHINKADERVEAFTKNSMDSLGNALPSSKTQRKVTDEEIEKFMNLFVGREDLYATIDYIDGRKQVEDQLKPLTKDAIKQHLMGEHIVATYIQRQNATVKALVIDLDVSRKVLIESGDERNNLTRYLRKAAEAATAIGAWFHRKNLEVRYEFSGGRGYHIWLFFEGWIPVYLINMLQDMLQKDMADKIDPNITMEFFPNKTRLKPGKNGQRLKLPMAENSAADVRSFLLDSNFTECANLIHWLDSAPRYSVDTIKKVLAVRSERQDDNMKKVVDTDLSIFGELQPNISEILRKCTLMRYLCRKACETGYLTHFERQSVLYVFAHVGTDGQNFVHQVMSYTLNYKYNVTDKFIRKLPEKPISCGKLREQYKHITAEIGCSCVFKRNLNCYPSPVLHAVLLSTDDANQVTLPVSRTLTKEKSQNIADQMNIHKRAQSLAVKIVELKKQRRGIDNSVRKIERELELIFDEEKTDTLELEMGLLVRRRIENGYEWLIEI